MTAHLELRRHVFLSRNNFMEHYPDRCSNPLHLAKTIFAIYCPLISPLRTSISTALTTTRDKYLFVFSS
jgi:hypothetical protein